MTDTTVNPVFAALSRFCFYMAALSCLFWFTSWPSIPYVTDFDGYYALMEDFPNCVSARKDNVIFGVGHLSHNRMSSLFLTRQGLEPGESSWEERPDGHFCGFFFPPHGTFQPSGFSIHLSSLTVGWDCPYWLMIVIWTAMFVKTRTQFRFRILDLFLATTVIAVVITLIRIRQALWLTVFLNVSTVALLCYLAFSALAVLFYAKNPWWPFVVPEGTECQRRQK
jgi:hypothetical protein